MPSWKPMRAIPPSGQCTPSSTSTGERALARLSEAPRRRPPGPTADSPGGGGVPPPESAGGRAPAAPTLAVLPAGSRTPAPRHHAREPWGCARRFGPKLGPTGPRLRQAPGGATGTARLQVFCSLLVDKPLGFRTASPPNPGVQSSSPPPAPHPALEPALA